MIGLNKAILSGTNAFSGIGFAIPSNTITKIVPILGYDAGKLNENVAPTHYLIREVR